MKSTLSLKQRLILLIASGMFISISATFFIIYQTIKPFVENHFLRKIDFLARHFASASIIGLAFKDKKYIQQLSEVLLKEEEIVGVQVLDAKGKIFFKMGRTTSNFPYLEKIIKPKIGPEGLVFSRDVPTSYGKIRLFYTLQPFHKVMKKVLFKIFSLAVIVILILSFLVFFSISRGIVSPLDRLTRAVSIIQEGQLEINIPISGAPEIQHLAVAFSQMVKSLKKSQEQLKLSYQKMAEKKYLAEIGKFSLIIAHEIKNPLGIIKGSLDVLKKQVDQNTKNQMIQFIEEEILRLNQLVQNFLSFARPKQVKKCNISLKEYLKDFQTRMALDLPQLKIKYSISPENLTVSADPQWFPQILLNLMRNAYEAQATLVKIVAKEEENGIILEIIDNGLGISEKDKDKIFEPFFTTKTRGSGLGLALVAQLMDLHHGKIEVYSQPSKGSVFRLFFPNESASI